MIIQVVKKYGYQVPYLINQLKMNHVSDDDKHKADMIFSTVHKSKGMEYDEVYLQNDFMSEEKLDEMIHDPKTKFDSNAMSEEINMLYVAVTRTKNKLTIPYDLLPFSTKDQYEKYKSIIVENAPEGLYEDAELEKETKDVDYYSRINEIKKDHKKAYEPWTESQDDELTEKFCSGWKTKDLADHFKRTKGAIQSRIKKLELREKYTE